METDIDQPSIIVRNLSVFFGDFQALGPVSLKMAARGINVLIGRSGCGKSTFLRSLNRLNEELGGGCEGEVWVRLDGQWIDVHDRGTDVRKLRRQVGMVFQTPNALPVGIAKNIILPLRLNFGLSKAEAEGRMEMVLKKVHLWNEVKDRLKASAVNLSGGQQQRLCLARTLAMEPRILLLDEPTSSLDFRATGKIEDLLRELSSAYTLVVVSHSLTQAKRLANEVFVFRENHVSPRVKKLSLADIDSEELVDSCF